MRRVIQATGGPSDKTLPASDTSFMQEAPLSLGHSASRAAAAPSSTRQGTFGLSAGGTRTARRIERYQLEERSTAGAGLGLGEGLLGAVRRPFQDDQQEEDEAPRKLTKVEKFKEVIHNSRSQRVADQRERQEREEQTKELDSEINSLLHLLPKRNKDNEEKESFLRSGTPEVRALLQSYRAKNPTAKCLTLKSSGEFSVSTLEAVANANHHEDPSKTAGTMAAVPKKSFLDSKDKDLLAQIRAGVGVSNEELDGRRAAHTAPQQEADDDDFDKLLNTMRVDDRRAHATERLRTAEEEAEEEAKQALLEADRSELPNLGLAEKDMIQRTRGEWVERGGDETYHMEDGENAYDDNVDIPSSYEGESDPDEAAATEEAPEEDDPTAAPNEGSHLGSTTLDRIMTKLEQLALKEAGANGERAKQIHPLLCELHAYARTHVLEVSNTFRVVLIEAERQFLRGSRQALSRPLMLYLYAITKVFPTSDYRHEVTTPFFLFLCSTLLQMKLDSMENVHCYMVLTILLTDSLKGGSPKFAAEAFIALFNILALQLPRSAIEPSRFQGLRLGIPLLERSEHALLLTSTADDSRTRGAVPAVHLLEPTNAEEVLLSAYRLLGQLADLYHTVPAFPAILLEPFQQLDVLLTEVNWRPSTACCAAHEALRRQLLDIAASVESHRTPLAMRTFRPRPLRQFDPLLAERPESAVRTEIREVKRTIREDKKRVVRQVTAEATVRRRAWEKEASMEGDIREKRYRQVMGELQSQQHLMNTVDSVMAKARSKKKKSISGLPKESQNEGGAE